MAEAEALADAGLASGVTEQRLAAVTRLQELASPPCSSEKAEDALHHVLVESKDENVAKATIAALWNTWLQSGDSEVDAAMSVGIRFLRVGEPLKAVRTFTEIIELAPDYVEGWNKRATAYFQANRFD